MREGVQLVGRYVTLENWNSSSHAEALWHVAGGAEHSELWRFMSGGPYLSKEEFITGMNHVDPAQNPEFFAIVSATNGRVIGRLSLLNVRPDHRTGEVGHVLYSAALQRTRGATEAQYLIAKLAFEQRSYRRYEWKCDSLNEKSRRAALRLGFQFEGIFRQHMIVKGRNRDTAWFSMLDQEWPVTKLALERWLDDRNFDREGNQSASLLTLRSQAAGG